ncbi:hypothetical protein BV20DRAFT_1057445 [Pilatotrama ljubarskyi]|nr:hypothetical protein BV20DRAFT_1057445 [Pilatotrama ljubarskyi]
MCQNLAKIGLHGRTIPNIIFQQDLDLKHVTMAWSKEHDIEQLNWAPSSPDMNIIEHA